MAHKKLSKATIAGLVGMAVLLLVILWLVISGSGLLPGDTGVEPIADPTEGRTDQVMNLEAWPWTIIVLVTTVILGIAIAYGQMRSNRITEAERQRTEAATRALHERERDPDFKD